MPYESHYPLEIFFICDRFKFFIFIILCKYRIFGYIKGMAFDLGYLKTFDELGSVYRILFSIIRDISYDMCADLDALCMRSPHSIDETWDIMSPIQFLKGSLV